MILFLTVARLFSGCVEKTGEEEPLKNLVADSGQITDKPLDHTELSDDIVISIQRPDIMIGEEGKDKDASQDSAVGEVVPPSEDDENDMSDFEGSNTDEDGGKDSASSDAGVVPPEEKPSDDKEEPETDEETPEKDELEDAFVGAGYAMYDVPLPRLKQIYVIETAMEFGIPPELIFGVMHVESRYTETAISKNGKYIGAMQIAKSNLKTLTKKFGITDLQDFQQNVTAGAYFLSYFYKKYDGDIDKVLMCYHCGEGGAKKSWQNGYYTDSYCRKVKKEMDRILLNFDPAQMSGKVSG